MCGVGVLVSDSDGTDERAGVTVFESESDWVFRAETSAGREVSQTIMGVAVKSNVRTEVGGWVRDGSEVNPCAEPRAPTGAGQVRCFLPPTSFCCKSLGSFECIDSIHLMAAVRQRSSPLHWPAAQRLQDES